VEGATLSYYIIGQPRRGVLTLVDPVTGQFQYRPRPGLYGPDRFTFVVSDGSLKSEPAVVEVLVEEAVGGVRLDDGTLEIAASPRSDLILLKQDAAGMTHVQIGSRLFGPYAAITSVSVQAGDGDDVVLAPGLTIPVVIAGGMGNDVLLGGDGDDILEGSEGDDCLFGRGGNDFLHGGRGDDLLLGGRGEDRLYGDEGTDDLRGGEESDIVVAGSGHDRLDGGEQDDLLIGGFGADVVRAGSGDDLVAGNYSQHGAVAFAGDAHDLALQMILAQWRATKSPGLLDAGLQEDHAADELFGEEGSDDVYATENDVVGGLSGGLSRLGLRF
jgi:hypothetical protein